MKIKTKTITYEEAMALPSWGHKKPKKPSALLAGVARLLLNGELKKLISNTIRSTWKKQATAPG